MQSALMSDRLMMFLFATYSDLYFHVKMTCLLTFFGEKNETSTDDIDIFTTNSRRHFHSPEIPTATHEVFYRVPVPRTFRCLL